MNILLDTHIALWAITDSPRLSRSAKEQIAHPKNQIWLSTVSLWEIAIKHSLRKGDMPIADLPNHHQDPFDRLLVAQAITEPMRLMTHDANIIKYGDMVIGV